jgi:ribosomal protein S21
MVIFLEQPRGYDRQNRGERTEPFEVMLRRFFRDIQQSGILTEIKKRRFRERELSREQIRESARRKAVRKKIKRGY